MPGIQVNVTMVTPPEKRDEVTRFFRAQLGRIRAERGCVRCDFWQQLDNPNSLRFVELWDGRPSLERHARSKFFGEILVLVELSTEPPEITFQTIAETADLDYLAALRGQSEPWPETDGND